MKLVANRIAVAEALEFLSSIVKAKSPKPVLTAVRLVAKDKKLCMAATDLELAAKWSMGEVDIAEDGEAVIPAERLTSVIKSISDGTVTIEAKEDTSFVRSSHGHFKLFGYPAADFPPLAEYERADTDIEIDGPKLSRMMEQVEFAVAAEVSRYAINSMLFEMTQGRLNLVATNGHRLSCVSSAQNIQVDGRLNLPQRPAKLLRELLATPECKCRIQIATGATAVTFAIFHEEKTEPTVTLRTALGEGTFPPYRDIIPEDPYCVAKINRDQFIRAVKQASLLTTEESKGIRLGFTAKSMQVSSRTPEKGEAVLDVYCEFSGTPLEIGFNPKYILDYLATVAADIVTLEMKSPNKPMLLRADPDTIYTIMPVNLT